MYQQRNDHGIDVAIRGEFSGDIKDGLLAILQCTTNRAEFFASRLHKNMKGIGTNDKQLIRLIVTRCEIDLNDIKVAFEKLYGKSLVKWIKVRTKSFNEENLIIIQWKSKIPFSFIRTTHRVIIEKASLHCAVNTKHIEYIQFIYFSRLIPISRWLSVYSYINKMLD